jgi:hypothetical protein
MCRVWCDMEKVLFSSKPQVEYEGGLYQKMRLKVDKLNI